MKKLKIHIYINLILSLVFSFLCLSFNKDISLLAFPLALVFTGVLAYVSLVILLKNSGLKRLGLVRRFYQYEPFVFISAFVVQRAGEKGFPYGLDLAAALLWVAILVSSFVIQFMLSDKRVGKVCEQWNKYMEENPKKVYHGMKKVGVEIAEWIDALVQAVFTIVLLNIFVFQLYEIPSESMVSTFLIGDRVAVGKTFAGPKFPLSDVGLPYINNYKRGDIVVFRNPHYSNDRKSEVKTFMSQFVYMLTLTFVKTNVDENGALKADPLVKRVLGLPGEQLMLMDGKLYARTKDSDFKEIVQDSSWAKWNLNQLPTALKKKVQYIPFPQDIFDETLQVEEERRLLDLESVKLECMSLSERFSKLAMGNHEADGSGLINERELFFERLGEDVYLSNLALRLLTSDGGSDWFSHYMNDWYRDLGMLNTYSEANGSIVGKSLIGGDLYSDSRFRLNLMFKLTLGRAFVRCGELLSGDDRGGQRLSDDAWMEQLDVLRRLVNYVYLMDQRNMGLFPANDASGNPTFIPEDSYFMMGDNRYNSLDMRHKYEKSREKLTNLDDYSVSYDTSLEPRYVGKNKILGKASVRIWPLDRIGSPQKK